MKLLLLIILIGFNTLLFGQVKQSGFFKNLYVGVKGGSNYIHGDVRGLSNFFEDNKFEKKSKDNLDGSYGINVYRQLMPYWNIGFEFNKGKISGSSIEDMLHIRSEYNNYHFNTKLMLNRMFSKRLNEREVLIYLEGGIGIMQSKGTVYKLIDEGLTFGFDEGRDYNNKSQLTTSYGVGFTFRMSKGTDLDIGLRKYIVQTDDLDGIKGVNAYNSTSDNMFNLYFGINKYLGKKRYKAIKWDRTRAVIDYSKSSKPKPSLKAKKIIYRKAGTKTIIAADGSKTVITNEDSPLVLEKIISDPDSEPLSDSVMLAYNTPIEKSEKEMLIDSSEVQLRTINEKNDDSKYEKLSTKEVVVNTPKKKINAMPWPKAPMKSIFSNIENTSLVKLSSMKFEKYIDPIEKKTPNQLAIEIEKEHLNRSSELPEMALVVTKKQKRKNKKNRKKEKNEIVEVEFEDLIADINKNIKIESRPLENIEELVEEEDEIRFEQTKVIASVEPKKSLKSSLWRRVPSKANKLSGVSTTLHRNGYSFQAYEVDYEEAMELQQNYKASNRSNRQKIYVLDKSYNFKSELKKYEFKKNTQPKSRPKVEGVSNSRKESVVLAIEIRENSGSNDMINTLENIMRTDSEIIHEITFAFKEKQTSLNSGQQKEIKNLSRILRLNNNAKIEVKLNNLNEEQTKLHLKKIKEIFLVKHMIQEDRIMVSTNSELKKGIIIISVVD
ncbi:MAG: hypothetical protein ACPGSD_08015 [Flavobacteriales bacterium]